MTEESQTGSAWRDRRLSAVRSFIRRWPVIPVVLILLFSWMAWYVGIRTKEMPTQVHSVGVVARVTGGDSIAGANVTAGSHCEACLRSSPIVRYNPDAGLRVDMVVSVNPGWFSCGNASVDMVVSGTPAFWTQHDRLGELPATNHGLPKGAVGGASASPPQYAQTTLAIGWDPGTVVTPPAGVRPLWNSPALVVFLPGEPQTPLHPSLLTSAMISGEGHQNRVTAFPAARPVGLRTQIYNWEGTTADPHEYTLQMRFTANWVHSRGFGNCYVVIPSLLANGPFAGTQNALEALVGTGNDTRAAVRTMNELLPYAQAPTFGRVALTTDGSVSLADSSPAPDDFESVYPGRGVNALQNATNFAALSKGRLSAVWSCSPTDDLQYLKGLTIPPAGAYTGNECGAVAVVYAQGVSSFRTFLLIILGVLIALAFERVLRRAEPERRVAGPGVAGEEGQAPESHQRLE
jgi:hypothetical protein